MDKIHEYDDMFHGSLEHYDSVGNQMAEFVEYAREIIGRPIVSILELPCGYGRVTRKLVSKFGSDRVCVAEIMAPAIDFCIRQFGVFGFRVEEPVNEFTNIPDSEFDIAVMGSLITHLSEKDSAAVFRNFFKKLKSGGVGIITTHGERARELMESSSHYQAGVCQVTAADKSVLLESYDDGNFGYAKYISDHTFEKKTVDLVGDGYGYSLIPKKWIEKLAKENSLEVKKVLPGGWDCHQDVFFILKA